MSVLQVTNSQNTSAPVSNRVVTSDMLDFQALRAFEKVKSDDGSEIVIELIDLYLQGTARRIIAMRNAANAADWDLLGRTAHTLKGSSSTLGLRQIARICRDLEDACLSSRADVHRLMSLLESRFVEVKPVLIRERNRRQTSPQ